MLLYIWPVGRIIMCVQRVLWSSISRFMANRTLNDAILAGAGFAGLSHACTLNRSGLRVAVIDRASPGSGASGTPGALLNPATGRRARKSWHVETCLPYSRDLI